MNLKKLQLKLRRKSIFSETPGPRIRKQNFLEGRREISSRLVEQADKNPSYSSLLSAIAESCAEPTPENVKWIEKKMKALSVLKEKSTIGNRWVHVDSHSGKNEDYQTGLAARIAHNVVFRDGWSQHTEFRNKIIQHAVENNDSELLLFLARWGIENKSVDEGRPVFAKVINQILESPSLSNQLGTISRNSQAAPREEPYWTELVKAAKPEALKKFINSLRDAGGVYYSGGYCGPSTRIVEAFSKQPDLPHAREITELLLTFPMPTETKETSSKKIAYYADAFFSEFLPRHDKSYSVVLDINPDLMLNYARLDRDIPDRPLLNKVLNHMAKRGAGQFPDELIKAVIAERILKSTVDGNIPEVLFTEGVARDEAFMREVLHWAFKNKNARFLRGIYQQLTRMKELSQPLIRLAAELTAELRFNNIGGYSYDFIGNEMAKDPTGFLKSVAEVSRTPNHDERKKLFAERFGPLSDATAENESALLAKWIEHRIYPPKKPVVTVIATTVAAPTNPIPEASKAEVKTSGGGLGSTCRKVWRWLGSTGT